MLGSSRSRGPEQCCGLPGEPGGRSPKCNGSTDGRGATWQQSRKQMRVGGTERCGKMRVRAFLQRAVHSLRLRRTLASHTEKESVVALRVGTGREGGCRVGGWKKNSTMLVLQLSQAIYTCSWTPKELCPCSYHSHSINRLLMDLWSQPNTVSPVYTKTRIIQGTHPSNHIHGILHQTTVTECQAGVQHAADLREHGAVEMGDALIRTMNGLKGNLIHMSHSRVFINGNNCSPKLETRDLRMCHVLS